MKLSDIIHIQIHHFPLQNIQHSHLLKTSCNSVSILDTGFSVPTLSAQYIIPNFTALNYWFTYESQFEQICFKWNP